MLYFDDDAANARFTDFANSIGIGTDGGIFDRLDFDDFDDCNDCDEITELVDKGLI